MNNDIFSERIYSVWLTLVFGAANPVINFLVRKYKSAENAFAVLNEGAAPELKTVFIKYGADIKKKKLDDAEKILDTCDKSGIKVMIFREKEYPSALRNIDNPPAVLYSRGNIDFNENPLKLALVGTRKPTEYSVRITRQIVKAVCKCGFDTVSGFAVGIDITSHLATVYSGRKTIAVLGSGINYDYPRDNIRYKDLICQNGALLSEYPPNAAPTRYSFPPRNRLISGLALGTAVIQAGMKSGSLITANHCNNQGKSLFVVPPGDITNVAYGGNVALLRDGAIPLMGATDVVYELYSEIKDELNENALNIIRTGGYIYTDVYNPVGNKNTKLIPSETDEENKEENDSDISSEALEKLLKNKRRKVKSSAEISDPEDSDTDDKDNKINEEKTKSKPDLSSLPENERLVAEIISNLGRAVIRDEIADASGIDPDELLELLTDMELEGIITSTAGGSYILN